METGSIKKAVRVYPTALRRFLSGRRISFWPEYQKKAATLLDCGLSI